MHMTSQWFSICLVSLINKTNSQNIAEILLKVKLLTRQEQLSLHLFLVRFVLLNLLFSYIAEILLKVALNTITLTLKIYVQINHLSELIPNYSEKDYTWTSLFETQMSHFLGLLKVRVVQRTCLNWTLNKTVFCINWTLNKVPCRKLFNLYKADTCLFQTQKLVLRRMSLDKFHSNCYTTPILC